MQAGRIKSVVVYAYNSELIPSFFFYHIVEGYNMCTNVKLIIGWMLVTFDYRESVLEAIGCSGDWFSQWLGSMRPWEPELIAKERFVWLRIEGIPLQIWGIEFFRSFCLS
jgi:hypothetical protein